MVIRRAGARDHGGPEDDSKRAPAGFSRSSKAGLLRIPDKIKKIVRSYKDRIPLSSVSDGIWSDPGNSKEFYVENGDEAVKQAAVVNTRADRLRSSVIHEQKHFLGEINMPVR